VLEESSNRRTVFFISDHSGVTAETMGLSLLSQFEGHAFQLVTLPFIDTLDKAQEAVLKIDTAAATDRARPLVFSTLVREAERDVVKRTQGLFLDFFEAFLTPLEAELGQKGAHALGRAHGMSDVAAYMARIDATNFSLAHDDGHRSREYERADLVLIGVSRTGKTPTCLYMALHYGIYAANCPLTDEDLEDEQLPAAVKPHASKLFGLTIQPARLQQIRSVRRPESRYASSQQVQYELRVCEQLYRRFNVPHIDTTNCSVEEISSRILQETGIPRRVRT
jgi:[pyruvate, water dikinase]-phosphate phosphotransferase / [pyruvate, water dikinase] kinase